MTSHVFRTVACCLMAVGIITAGARAQNSGFRLGIPPRPLPTAPLIIDTAEQHKLSVSVVAHGMVRPFSLAILPNGDMLVTERNRGRLRIIRNGVLDPEPLPGVPPVFTVFHAGLQDIALHPKFSENQLLYFSYSKPSKPGDDSQYAIALARARFTPTGLTNVEDLFVGNPTTITGPSRLAFAPDGLLYMTTGAASNPKPAEIAQDVNGVYGKVLRFKDDGSVPQDNPFVGRAGHRPEIYSLGHRDHMGLTVHPATGMVFNGEEGPVNGDKVNIILPGRNYGWPRYGYGRYNDASPMEHPNREGIEPALITWQPGITPSGMTFYTGDRFPRWKGNLFVGGLRRGQIPGTGSLERIVFNEKWWELRRESLLTDLHLRIRDVRQGPDGLLYVLTDEEDAAVLRLEPAPQE